MNPSGTADSALVPEGPSSGLAAPAPARGRARIAAWSSAWIWPRHRRAARLLHRFALAEASSRIDLQLAARATPDPRRAAEYLRHADDEAKHARMFERAARRRLRALAEGGKRVAPLPPLRADSEALFEGLGELDFLAFVHVGEARAIPHFEAYQAWCERAGLAHEAQLFAEVLIDERRHAAYTWARLVELTGDIGTARRALRRVKRWEFGRAWLRGGRGFATAVYGVGMVALSLLALGLRPLVRWARPEARGWQVPSNHVKREELGP